MTVTAAARLCWLLTGLSGLLAVGLGAYAAHGLAGADDRLAGMMRTAVEYHLLHTVAAAVACAVASFGRERRWLAVVTAAGFLLGIAAFAGSLYAHALTGGASSTALAPSGGAALMLSWLLLGLAGYRTVGRAA